MRTNGCLLLLALSLYAASAQAQQITTPPPPSPVVAPPPMAAPKISPSAVAVTPPCRSETEFEAGGCPPRISPAPPVPVPLPAPPGIPSLASGGAPAGGSAMPSEKVLSYFQRGKSDVDTAKTFGFVLLPKSAVTESEQQVQDRFCRIMLASLDFMAPETAARADVLVTFWPVVAEKGRLEIEAAFDARNCGDLISWYDHRLARSIARRFGLEGMSGPLLITLAGAAPGSRDRQALVVDFARADYPHAAKALNYWFGELRKRPDLWRSRIREGTIRADLAEAINETAGVVLKVLYGKWDDATPGVETP